MVHIEETLEELALKLRESLEFYDQGIKDYPHSSGTLRAHLVWKIAEEIARRVGYIKNREIR